MENAMLKIKYKMLIYFDHMDVFFLYIWQMSLKPSK